MLRISRPDITGDELQYYPLEKRFIKLSVAKYFEGREMTMSRPQVAIVNALNNSNYKFVTAAVSRRLGKTYIANVIAHLVSMIAGVNILVMSPNYTLSGISYDLQEELMRYSGIESERANLKDRIITMKNTSTIRLGSINQVDSSIGRSYNFIIFDEAAVAEGGKDAFETQLLPTLDRPNSKCLFISTPRGKKNWFAEFYYRGYSADNPRWISIQADYLENDRANAQDIETARKSISAAKFKQEFEADFNVFEGQIYKFNNDKCVEDLSYMDWSKLDRFAGVDIGFKDPTAFSVIGFDEKTGHYYVLDEYLNSEAKTSDHAVAIKERMTKYEFDTIYVDSAAAQTRFDWAYEYDIPTIGAKKSVNDGIAFVQNIVERDLLVVDEKCTHTLAMLDQFRWDDRPLLQQERPVHDQFIHMADALRYAIYSHGVASGIF
jgi:hypothetical protein